MDMRLVTHTKLQENGCLEWQRYRNLKGYGMLRVDNNSLLVHRYVWELLKGTIPQGMLVCHSCDNPSCVNIDHLFLGTNQDNMSDMCNKRRSPVKSGLTEDDVKLIRKLAECNSHNSIAPLFNISRRAVTKIVNVKSWRHI